jgi:hypothetical protein
MVLSTQIARIDGMYLADMLFMVNFTNLYCRPYAGGLGR